MRALLARRSEDVPTAVDITPQLLDRAATAILAAEAEEALTDCYGRATRGRAKRFARAALEAALDLRRED